MAGFEEQLASSHMRKPCVWEAWSREVTRFAVITWDGHRVSHKHPCTRPGAWGGGFETHTY